VATIDQIYRDNLRLLIDEAGSQNALAELIDKAPAQISQWLNASIDPGSGKPRVMSRASARHIEIKCKKPQGWMDQPHPIGVAPPPEKGRVFHELTDAEWEFLNDLRQIPDPDRVRYAKEIADRANVMREFLAAHMERAGLPAPRSAAARKPPRTENSTVEPTQRSLELDKPK
jgi:hypothetical protein